MIISLLIAGAILSTKNVYPMNVDITENLYGTIASDITDRIVCAEESNSSFILKKETKMVHQYDVNHRSKRLFLNTAPLSEIEEPTEEILDTSIVPPEPTEFLQPGQYRTKKQNMYHEIAETARATGLPEDSPIIQEAKRLWEQEQYDLNIMAKVGFNEAGGCEWQQLLDTLAVLKNRVDSPYWPNTVYDVVVAPYQYLEAYTRNFEGVSARAYAAAVIIMDEVYEIPKNVVFQANFPQGSGTWRIAECHVGSFHSITWFGYDLASREYPDD
jgi:hypothetical protein